MGQPCPEGGPLLSRIPKGGGSVSSVLVHEGGQIFDLVGDDPFLWIMAK